MATCPPTPCPDGQGRSDQDGNARLDPQAITDGSAIVAAFDWGAARLRRMVLGNPSHARVLADRLGLDDGGYQPLSPAALASSVRIGRGWSPDVLAVGDTANNLREFDGLRRILFEQGLDLTFGVYDDEFVRARPADHARVTRLAEDLPRDVATRDATGVAGAVLMRQIDVFAGALLGAWVGWVEPGATPRLAAVANDHSPAPLGFIAAMRAAGVPTLYLQHAAVTAAFPPLDFDLSVLRDARSRRAYTAAGPVAGEVRVLPRAARANSPPATLTAPVFAGVYTTSAFDAAAAREALRILAANPDVAEVFLKPHPNTRWPDGSDDLRVLARMDEDRPHVAVCGNSSVTLDLVRRGLPVVQLFALDGLEPDYYGFAAEGLAPAIDMGDLAGSFWTAAKTGLADDPEADTDAEVAGALRRLTGDLCDDGLAAWARTDARIPSVVEAVTSEEGRALLHGWLQVKRAVDVRLWSEAAGVPDLARSTVAGLRGGERSALAAAGGRLSVEIAKIARRAGRDAMATLAVEAALILRPGHAQMLALRAELAAARGDHGAARTDSEAALAADPLTAVAAQVLRAVGAPLPDGLAERVEAAVAEAPTDKALSTLTRRATDILMGHDRLDAAERVLAGALDRLDPGEADYARFAETYGRIAESRGQEALAEERYARFDRASVERGWGPAFGLGVARTLIERHRLADAEVALGVVEARHGLDPSVFEPTRFQLLLSADRIGEAYALYRQRPVTEAYRAAFGERYVDSGADLDAQLTGRRPLFVSEAGIGDEIRLAALYDDILARWGSFAVTCEPRLLRLFRANWPDIDFIPVARQRRGVTGMETAGREAVPAVLRGLFDDAAFVRAQSAPVVASLYDLLAALRPDRAAFPRRARVLAPLPEDAARWSRPHAGPARVAVSWRSLMRGAKRDRHYLQPAELGPLIPPGAEVWVVQPQAEPDEIDDLRRLGHPVIVPDLDLRDDIEGLAGLLSRMDLTIGPGTTVTELAGAVGCDTVLVGRMAGVLWRGDAQGRDVWSGAIRIHDGRGVSLG